MWAWAVLVLIGLAWGYRDLPGSFFLRDDFMWLLDGRRQLDRPIEFLTTRPSGYFRPFANIVFGMEQALFGLRPAGYFVVNILIHAWSAFWLGALVCRFGGSLRFAGAAALVVATMGAAGAGVVWISGLVSVLAVAMILPALFFYARFLQHKRPWDYRLGLAFVILAVCSRESGVLAGIGVLVLEAMYGGGLGVLRQRGFWLRMAPFMVAGAGYVWAQIDFVTGTGERDSNPGGPLQFLEHLVTSVPAMLRPVEWRLWFSAWGGFAFLAATGALLGLLRGRRGLMLFGALTLVLVFAFLPTYPMLSKSEVMANRYRYEGCFAMALMLAAVFDAGMARRNQIASGLSALGLAGFVVWQLGSLPSYVEHDDRFAAYADSTRLMVDSLEAEFGDALRASKGTLVSATARVVALVGAPVENPRHLRDQLEIWYGFDGERVAEVNFDLEPGDELKRLKREWDGYIKEMTGANEVWIWDDAHGFVGGRNPLAAMRRDWRKPGRRAMRSKVQVLTFNGDEE